jgi:acyl-coenzyme A synthetase/AMP-(fatty) acid ligase
MLLAKDLGYMDEDNYVRLYDRSDEIGKMLHSVYRQLQ